MAQCDIVEMGLLEKLVQLLVSNPEKNDVSFSVGPEKKIVKAVRIILEAASPVFHNEFRDKWQLAILKDGEGIPLPDFDPEAFEIFVMLTTLDVWSVRSLKKLNLKPNNLLNLLSICRKFDMKKAVNCLEALKKEFEQSFSKFKDTDDVLKLSPVNFEAILASDDLGGIDEMDVFKCALKWAASNCIEPTESNCRNILGRALFEIRFPIMTNTEFTDALDLGNLLTADEIVAIYRFIGLGTIKRKNYDVARLAFKTQPRKIAKVEVQQQQPLVVQVQKPAIVQPLPVAPKPLVVQQPPVAPTLTNRPKSPPRKSSTSSVRIKSNAQNLYDYYPIPPYAAYK